MFEKKLLEDLKAIFEVDKVTFDMPSNQGEQTCIFVEVDVAVPTITDNSESYRVNGNILIYSPNNKLPFGFFMKQIIKSGARAKDFHFFNFEENDKRFQNIVARTLSFVYFFNGQYDPSKGTINSLTTQVTTQ